MVNFLGNSTNKMSVEKTSSKELENIDDRSIIALETSQVKEEDHSEFDHKKELKSRYVSKDVDKRNF